MKCSRCREHGHNRTTCPKNPPRPLSGRLSQSPPDDLMRMLIDPAQALALVAEGKVAEALANATRRIGEMNRDDLGHLACSDILIALAELDLRGKQISPEMLDGIRSTGEDIEAAKAALVAAERAHARAKAEVLSVIGYRERAEAMGFCVGIVETSAEVPSNG